MASRRPEGLGTIFQRKSDGRFVGAIYLDTVSGMRKRFVVYGRTRKEAEEKLASLAHQAATKQLMPDANWNVGEYLDHWIAHIAPKRLRPKTLQNYAGSIRMRLKPYLGGKSLRLLTVADVQSAIDTMHQDGVSPRGCEQAKTALSAALTRAMKDDLIFRNVARLVETPKFRPKVIIPWTLSEAQSFMQAIEAHRWEVGYLINLLYGARQGEVLGLQWRDFHFKDERFSISKQLQTTGHELSLTPPKTDASIRELPIVPLLKEKLVQLAEKQGITLDLTADPTSTPYADLPIVQSKEGDFVWPKNYVRRFYEFLEVASIRRITPHTMRHTMATALKTLGVQARDAQLILGHSTSSTTTQIYQHGQADEHRDALLKVSDALIAGTVADSGDVSSTEVVQPRSYQMELHARSDTTAESPSQVFEDTKNRRSPEVETAELHGGSGGARTHDILLKRDNWNPYVRLSTSVNEHLLARTKLSIIGCVAIKSSYRLVSSPVRSFVSPERQLTNLLIQAAQLKEAAIEPLRRMSFPLNLIPLSAPTIE